MLYTTLAMAVYKYRVDEEGHHVHLTGEAHMGVAQLVLFGYKRNVATMVQPSAGGLGVGTPAS